jgi:hypothetical protein
MDRQEISLSLPHCVFVAKGTGRVEEGRHTRLILGEVARPERFESAFWFVAEKSGNPKALQVSHLQTHRLQNSCLSWSTSWYTRVHEKGAQTGDETLSGPQVGSTSAAAIEDA